MPRNGTQVSRSSQGGSGRKLHIRDILEKLNHQRDDNTSIEQRMRKTEQAVQELRLLHSEVSLQDRAKNPGEAFLDSEVVRTASELLVGFSEEITGNINNYDKIGLAQHIRNNPSFWEFPFPREVPPVAFLFGTFAPTPPEERPRVPRRRVERQQAAALIAPETVQTLEKTDEGSEVVEKVYKHIKEAWRRGGKRPLSYFHVVLDPDSFSRTVENVYNVSFLVRDGRLAINLDKEYELPFMEPVARSKQAIDPAVISDENQFIVSIDMQRWRELVDAFDIREPMMVSR